ncbi:LysR family transcriptional regulator [Novosphingobium sp. 1949]|uniref:LysR family transcriptional regulator n=1 Tax=Novosphingobium organovorum TaxID=2930092 RepID=A0ABT0BCU4_9SPHN|nr:LysR family transcriptional regulator [Novosphingobium organovorum]MCJ2182878.1 LysR family transcriptional regulator [Novosphingobium organovorum]
MTPLDRFARNLDWNLLKYFTQIARHGGIGAAATSLNLSQPSVSAALRKLEDHVGAQLVIRSPRGVRLTLVGEAFSRECEQILSRIEAMPSAVRELTGTIGGSVLVKTISHVASAALDAGLLDFRERHPDVELMLETAPWEDIAQALLEGQLAVGVGFDDAQHPALQRAVLTYENIQIYCAKSHPLASRTIDTPSDLANEPFIAFSAGEPAALKAFRERHGLGERIVGFANTVHDAAWLVSLGVGIGMLPEPAASTLGDEIVPILARAAMPRLAINLFWRSDLQDRASELLVEAILAQIDARIAQ